MRRRIHACHMRRRIHACHMRRRIHACHIRRRIHACHMGRRIHACHMRRRIHTSREDALAHVEDMFQSPGLADIRKTQFFFCLQKFAKLSALVLVCPSIGVPYYSQNSVP
jgi:hypothetical protein